MRCKVPINRFKMYSIDGKTFVKKTSFQKIYKKTLHIPDQNIIKSWHDISLLSHH